MLEISWKLEQEIRKDGEERMKIERTKDIDGIKNKTWFGYIKGKAEKDNE